MYILSEDAQKKIADSAKIKGLLAAKLDKGGWTIWNTNRKNEANNILTTAAAIDVIKKETGLKQSEILTKIK